MPSSSQIADAILVKCVNSLSEAGLTENSNPVAIQAVLDRVSLDVQRVFSQLGAPPPAPLQLGWNHETKTLIIGFAGAD